jgi:hypothetical protein
MTHQLGLPQSGQAVKEMKMKTAHINYSGMELDYRTASSLATSFADKDPLIIEPVMVAWHDKKASRMSPVIEGGDINTRWHDYGESHGGKLEVDINGEFDFIFADSSAYEPYGPSPYINLHDKRGNEYLCQINALRDPHNPSREACVELDDWTSKLT